MKIVSRTPLLSLIVVIILIFFGNLFIGPNSDVDCKENCTKVESNQLSAQSQLTNQTITPAQQITNSVNSTLTDKSLIASKNSSKLTKDGQTTVKRKQIIKHYDENWCYAKDELSETDYHFAKSEYEDWLVIIGKARVKDTGMLHARESSYPNNNLIEAYEALSLDQLQSQALKGNKWAMVTFVQNRQASNELKDFS